MTKLTNEASEERTEVASNDQVAVSLVFRGVPKDKRVQLEKLAREFTKKYRKLVNYIEK